MELRPLGKSGLQVPVLCYGTGTFGGRGELFEAWGSTEVDEARHLIDICLEAGVNMFDTADAYSMGRSEEVLGEAVKGRRDQVIIATKAFFGMGPHPNQGGTSRYHLIAACEASLRRLGTDYIDLYQMHCFDAIPPTDETLRALDDLVTAGKVRYIGASNFSGWHLMKSLAVSDRYGWSRYVAHQVYYSLVGREFEWELMPLGIDQGVGALIWSPLGWGRLTGKIRRNQPLPEVSRLPVTAKYGPPVDDELLFNVVDVLEALAKETGKSIPQIALNWLLRRPNISSVIIGARNEEQLRDNLAAAGWSLTPEQVARLDAASYTTPVYPYWHQRQTALDRNPPPVPEPANVEGARAPVTAASAGADFTRKSGRKH
jgi:aryl-alcohol dehydrogenase-like predicted oxidoreductase